MQKTTVRLQSNCDNFEIGSIDFQPSGPRREQIQQWQAEWYVTNDHERKLKVVFFGACYAYKRTHRTSAQAHARASVHSTLEIASIDRVVCF